MHVNKNIRILSCTHILKPLLLFWTQNTGYKVLTGARSCALNEVKSRLIFQKTKVSHRCWPLRHHCQMFSSLGGIRRESCVLHVETDKSIAQGWTGTPHCGGNNSGIRWNQIPVGYPDAVHKPQLKVQSDTNILPLKGESKSDLRGAGIL